MNVHKSGHDIIAEENHNLGLAFSQHAESGVGGVWQAMLCNHVQGSGLSCV